MRFDQHENPPTILTAKDQRRLILLGLSLMAVVFAIKVAAKPEFWARLFPEQAPAAANLPDDNDVSLEDAPRPLDPDEFLTSDDKPSAPQALAGVAPGISASQFPRELLRNIQDNSLGVRYRESAAYYTMLAAAKRVKHKRLEAEAEKNVTFPVLMANPDQYRGRPVTISGTLRRVDKFQADPNSLGVDDLYDAWVFPRDAGAKPIHVVCSSLGEEIQDAGQLKQPVNVRVAGYFFKKEAYSTRSNGLNIVPLVLGSHLGTEPIAEVEIVNDGSLEKYLFWFSLIVAAALAMMLWNFAVSDWEFRTGRVSRSLDPPRVADLNGVESVDIGDVLKNLQLSDVDESSVV